ncbi:SdrD B-like domain-containing protein [Spirosoma sp. 209]|uniref:SdrD B-like domain-containing protein n=1 Tax=Spirosoma sp. 209 TaxID=1955701 RepID=UPI00098D1982|nr:SdrD B-like domain-containing protein [Spirosoma sp. 209]
MKQLSSFSSLLTERLVRVAGLWLLILVAQTAGASAPDDSPPGNRPPGARNAPKALALGNRVFHDYNRNGRQDDGEVGIGNVKLRLYQQGIQRGQTTSDANGQYTFDDAVVTGGLKPNTAYEIRVATTDLPAGFSLTKRNQGDTSGDSDAQVIGNQIVVFAATGGTNSPNDSYDIGLAAGAPDLSLTKTATVTSVTLGSNAGFTIRVDNISPDGVATNVVVKDTLDAGVLYVSSSPAATVSTTPSSQTVLTWSLGTMLAGATSSINLTVKTNAEGIVYNTAYVTTADAEISTRNNVSRAGVTVPVKMCPGESYVASLPVGYTNVQWYRNANPAPVASGNSFTITQAGSYSFTTTANVDCPASGCVPLVIEDGILPNLSAVASATAICVGGSTSLTATGCGTGTILWSTGSSAASITVSPTSTTAYSFTCTSNTYGTCTASTSTTITVNPNPVVTLSSTTVCAGATASLTATPGYASYVFSPGLTQVGGASGNTATLATSLSAAGSTTTYSVTAISTSGCSATASGAITVNPNPVITLSSTTVCAGTTASLTATPGYASYVFSAGLTQVGGASGNTATLATSLSAANSSTVYSVTAISAEGCTAVGSGTVVVNSNPVITLSSTTVCAGTTASLTATPGYASYVFSAGLTQVGGASGNTATLATSLSAANSSTVYSVTAISAEGCTAVGSGTVVVNSNPVITLSSTTVCAGTTASLTATPGYASYVFSPGLTQVGGASGNTATLATSLSAANSSTVYSVTAISAEGCTAVGSGTVVVNANPVASITVSNATICSGQSSTLTASGGATYRWSTNEVTAAISVTSTGVYSVTVTNQAGCSDVTSATVTVSASPQLTIDSATICAGTSTNLVVGGCEGGSILWSTGDNTASLSIEPLVTTTYSATCTFSTGCSSTIATTITVNNAPTFDVAPTVTAATCTGANSNSDARFDFTTLQNVERADIVPGSSYGSGPVYGAASNKLVVSGAVSFTGIANPTQRQTYTVRLFSAGGTCVTDVTVTLDPVVCECPAPKCVPVVIRKVR